MLKPTQIQIMDWFRGKTAGNHIKLGGNGCAQMNLQIMWAQDIAKVVGSIGATAEILYHCQVDMCAQ